MNTWKVILATLVIFTAGLFTGAVLVRKWNPVPWTPRFNPPPPGQGPLLPMVMRDEYVQRLHTELNLSPGQGREISRIVSASQQRVQEIFDRVGPDMQQEMQQVTEAIRQVLTDPQREKFDEMRRFRHGRPGDRPPDGRRFRFRGPPYPGEAPPPGGRRSPEPDSSSPPSPENPQAL